MDPFKISALNNHSPAGRLGQVESEVEVQPLAALSPEWAALLRGTMPDTLDELPWLLQLLVGFSMLMCIIGAYDLLVARGKPGDWFEIHAFANLLVVVASLPAILLWLNDPISVVISASNETRAPDLFSGSWWSPEVLLHPNNHWGVLTVIAVHTYHCVKFDLSKQDMFHHFVFVPTIGVWGGFCLNWGPIRNCVCFFISGLPGGVDYVNLVAVKRGVLSKLSQKRICSKINLWLRGPGVGVLIPGTCYCAMVYGHVQGWADIAKVFVVAAFCCYNGVHYMEMAIKNYQMHLTKAAHGKELKAKHDKELAYWVAKSQATIKQPAPSLLRDAASDPPSLYAADGTKKGR